MCIRTEESLLAIENAAAMNVERFYPRCGFLAIAMGRVFEAHCEEKGQIVIRTVRSSALGWGVARHISRKTGFLGRQL